MPHGMDRADILIVSILSIPVNCLVFDRQKDSKHGGTPSPLQLTPELHIWPGSHRAVLLAPPTRATGHRPDLPAAGQPPDRAGIGPAQRRWPADPRSRCVRALQLAAQRLTAGGDP